MNITCIIKLNLKLKGLYLSINHEDIHFKWNKLTESYSANFNYPQNTKFVVKGSKPKNINKVNGIIQFFQKEKLINIQIIKINSTERHFQFEIKKLYKKQNNNFLFNEEVKGKKNKKNSYLNLVIHRPSNLNNKNNVRARFRVNSFKASKSDGTFLKEKKEIKESIIEVFYGTNRKKSDEPNLNNYFGNEIIIDSSLNVGKCTVSIPDCHTVGKIERPKKLLIWKLREQKSKHILLETIQEIDEEKFYNQLKDDLSKVEENSFLLFVHGYNNSFAETAWRTAQIAYDISFNGLAGFFSWPSLGKTSGYIRDMDMVSASTTSLTEFINSIITTTSIKKMHIIAHSMGNVLVTASLKELASNPKYAKSVGIIEQVVLAAPDIDQNVFRNEILPIFKTVGKSRTMYISDKDVALKASKTLRAMPRLGQAGAIAFVDEDLYSIDASNIKSSGLNHSYIFDTKLLLNDLFHLIEGITDPKKRNLKKNSKLWYFPK